MTQELTRDIVILPCYLVWGRSYVHTTILDTQSKMGISLLVGNCLFYRQTIVIRTSLNSVWPEPATPASCGSFLESATSGLTLSLIQNLHLSSPQGTAMHRRVRKTSSSHLCVDGHTPLSRHRKWGVQWWVRAGAFHQWPYILLRYEQRWAVIFNKADSWEDRCLPYNHTGFSTLRSGLIFLSAGEVTGVRIRTPTAPALTPASTLARVRFLPGTAGSAMV